MCCTACHCARKAGPSERSLWAFGLFSAGQSVSLAPAGKIGRSVSTPNQSSCSPQVRDRRDAGLKCVYPGMETPQPVSGDHRDPDPGLTQSSRVKGPWSCFVAPSLSAQLTPLRPSLGFGGATSSSQLFLPVILRYYWHCQPFRGAFRYCSSRGDKEPHAEISHHQGPRATARLKGEAVGERRQHLVSCWC